ncbi:hypothetical protein HOD61_01390 [archaeon]|jgi:hypothetical protein|nr:hypothetical protein [archaeon]
MKIYKTKNNCGDFHVQISKSTVETIVRSSMDTPGSCSKYYSAADRLSYDLNFSGFSEEELISKYELKTCPLGKDSCPKLLVNLLKQYNSEN